jgi:hypothetical protein
MKSCFTGRFDKSEKGDVSIRAHTELIPRLHSAFSMLQTTAYLLLGLMAPSLGIFFISMKTENWIFLAGLTILKKKT